MIWLVLLAAMSGAPFYFYALWHKRWFKIVWCLAMLFAISGLFRAYSN